MMEEQAARQAQGAVDLLNDAVQAGARSIGAAHLDIADLPYAVLRHIPVISRPARAIGHVQMNITRAVYRSVENIAGSIAAWATLLLRATSTTPKAPPAPDEQ